MIDIIITGDYDSLEKTLFSICIQTISDKINVIVVSNKKHSFVSEFEKKIKIQEIITKEKSIGKKRQIGYDSAKNEYLLFMNSGDVFYDVFALHNLYKIKDKNDIVIGGISNIEKKYSSYYLVGNLYRRKGLVSHRILFSDSNGLENGFHQLYFMTHPKIVYSEDIIYHQNIVIDKNYDYYHNLIQDSLFAVSKAKVRSYKAKDIARLLYDVVLTFSYVFHNHSEDYFNDLFQEFIPLLEEYHSYQKYLNSEDIQYISDINLTNQTIDDLYLLELENKNRV